MKEDSKLPRGDWSHSLVTNATIVGTSVVWCVKDSADQLGVR